MASEYDKRLIEEFIDWVKYDSGEDAFYIFDNPHDAIDRFIKQRDN